MKITYLGHASFLLETSAGTRIVTDPYAQDILPHPVARAQVVTMSHEHHDHCDLSQVKGDYVIVNTEKNVTFLDVKITCIPCWHDEVQGKKRGHNRAYVFEADGLKVVHLGDLGEVPTPALVEACAGADVLFIPVGGTYTLTAQQAAEQIRAMDTEAIVPMHYSNQWCAFDITPITPFLHQMNLPFEEMDEFIPGEEFAPVVVLSLAEQK